MIAAGMGDITAILSLGGDAVTSVGKQFQTGASQVAAYARTPITSVSATSSLASRVASAFNPAGLKFPPPSTGVGGSGGGGGFVQAAGPGPASSSLFGLPRVAVIGGGAVALLAIVAVGIKIARKKS